MSFKENLKEAMYCKNLTTIQLAELTDINAGTISSYLKTKGSMPPADKALKLARVLDVSVDFLVNGFESNGKPQSERNFPFSAEIYRLAEDLSKLNAEERNAIKEIVKLLHAR